MNIFEVLDSLDHTKLILLLETEKDPCKLENLLSAVHSEKFSIKEFGSVRNLNTVQYLLAKAIEYSSFSVDDVVIQAESAPNCDVTSQNVTTCTQKIEKDIGDDKRPMDNVDDNNSSKFTENCETNDLLVDVTEDKKICDADEKAEDIIEKEEYQTIESNLNGTHRNKSETRTEFIKQKSSDDIKTVMEAQLYSDEVKSENNITNDNSFLRKTVQSAPTSTKSSVNASQTGLDKIQNESNNKIYDKSDKSKLYRVNTSYEAELVEEYKRSAMIVIKKSSMNILNHEDSIGNNVLHYCAVLGSYDLTKLILDMGVNIKQNSCNSHAYEYCKEARTHKLLKTWAKTDISSNFVHYWEKRKNIIDFDTHESHIASPASPSESSYGLSNTNDLLSMKPGHQNDESEKNYLNEKFSKISLNVEKNENSNRSFSSNNVKYYKPDSESLNKENASCIGSTLNSSVLSNIGNLQSVDNTEEFLGEDIINLVNNKYVKNKDGNLLYTNCASPLVNEEAFDTISGGIQRSASFESLKANNMIEEREIKRLPGKLYIYLSTVVGYFTLRKDIKEIKFRISYNDETFDTRTFTPSSHIEIDEMFVLELKRSSAKIIIYMIVKFDEETTTKFFLTTKPYRKVLKSNININKDNLHKIHNNLCQKDAIWKRYKTGSIVKVIKDVFDESLPDASMLKCHLAFISTDEFRFFKIPRPHNFKSLSYWLRYRKNSFNKWFVGYVNIRGDNCTIATHLWRRRLVQWIGYSITVYNEITGVMIGKFDITGGKYSLYSENSESTVLENSVKLFLKDKCVEIQFDTKGKYNDAVKALTHMLD
ncbi:hypothetical protein EDEG_03413 [Edhazardia aedis USNM 41457]|uniref:Uncharacterized protein n=1 Tax=Edhazardia aedis (strain USNM 41457) TaxID=1003232 RepID=J9DHQ6_EDHAE|nr:hypothetical protein EDEG_03413 [Edhazardia aedis USNM 41457]|eukprot:EJW02145.1 hypothetical protein EDEG_03413 [Edhazardia aedis USNM 41457]